MGGLLSSLWKGFTKPMSMGNLPVLSPTQMGYLNSVLGGGMPQLGQGVMQNLLSGISPEQFQSFYDQSFVQPAQQTFQRSLIPALKENFLGGQERASSSLDRALAQAATDVSTQMGSGLWNAYNQNLHNQLGGLGQLNSLMGVHAMNRYYGPSPLHQILNGLSSLGGGWLSGLTGG